MSRSLSLLLVLALMCAGAAAWADAHEDEAAPAAQAWYEKIIVNGYFQARYEARMYDSPEYVSGGSSSSSVSEFTIRRLYINIIAPLTDRSQAVVTWAGVGPTFRDGANSDWANIFVDYKVMPEFTLRLGQAPTHFGIDTCESATCLVTPERWVGGEGKPGLGLRGLYFAGPWDRGLWAMYDTRPRPNVMVPSADNVGWRAVASVHNGEFRSSDVDNHKNLSLDLTYFGDWGQVGGSWLQGRFTGQDRNALGGSFRIYPGVVSANLGLQGEYLTGEWLGADKSAWYGQASYNLPGPGSVYTRYEEFNPDRDMSGNNYRGWHLGYVHDFTPVDELTLQYTLGRNAGVKADEAIVSYQRRF